MSIARHITIRWQVPFFYSLAALFAAFAHAGVPDIPIAPGVTFVIALSDKTGSPQLPKTTEHFAQGDYETVVTITAANADGVSHTASIDGVDESGVRRQVRISRQVLTADLANSHLQILGFRSLDPPVVAGTTSIGPSLAVTRELLTTGRTTYSFRNFANRDTISGTLIRGDAAYVKFSVLVNGQRTELNAIHATGQMASGSAARPFEHYILDHPRYPISLRIAFGPRGGAFPFKAEFAREVVRIDFPVERAPALNDALAKNCRVEVPGIYFDFNEATLKPQSLRALQEIATALRQQPQRRISIEGHTDNIGGERYNDDLSARRAAAVAAALERDFHIDPANVSTKGHGARRPVESNDTLAGRAHNRRVELVRECAGNK